MINVLLPNIFNSKIIGDQREGDWAGEMSPEAWGMLAFVITMREETFSLLRCLLGEGPTQLDAFQESQTRSLRACRDCIVP